MAKFSSIASMCVHPEVTHRPFMDHDTCGDCFSLKDSSAHESDYRGDNLAPSDSSWWNDGGLTPRLTYGETSFITMEYSSGPLEMENSQFSTSSLVEDIPLPIRHGNMSCPLRTNISKLSTYRFTGSRSEHGGFSARREW
ncbi:unnamed protein product [Lupinus luteus]|uniref:Uncharacterized protein n=1 Tax=Lupinus luteus TaxID=3873 RepID=A0AAV1WL58_LUPLU